MEEKGSQTRNPEVINLLDCLEILARHWRMSAKVTAAALVVSTAIAFAIPKIYSSTAMILPPQQDNSMMAMMSSMSGGMASLASDLLGKGTPADLYVGILNSGTIKDAIIDRFKLMEVYDEDFRLDTYRALDKRVDIAAGKKDGIISIVVQDKDPKRAAAMANAFVDELGKLSINLSISGAGQNRAYLEKRLAKSKADLARAEEALKAFQSKNKALDVPDQAKTTIMGVAQLKAQLAVQEAQLAALRSRFTEGTQDVRDMKATVANIRSQIAQLEGNGRGSSIPSLGTVPELGQEYVRLMRGFKEQEAIFELLTKQYELAKMSESKDVDGIQVIQRATVPDKKSKPKRLLIMLGGTFAAFACSLFYAFFLESAAKMPNEHQRLKEIIALARGRKRSQDAGC